VTTVLLASAWETLGLTVLAGFIVAAVSGAATWGIRRRGQRNRWLFQEYLNRSPYRAGLSAVASELKKARATFLNLSRGCPLRRGTRGARK
jgi:hypothetical protein